MSIRVMVVEDEKDVRDEYRLLIRESVTMRLVAETDDTDEALRMLESTAIDALILDLELRKGSGILLLQKMQEMNIKKPFVAVVTNVISKALYDAIRSMGADYICTKGDKDFSLAVPLSIIEISAPYQRTKTQAKSISGQVNKSTMFAIYCRNIEEELEHLGFSNKMLGTTYCKEAILHIVMQDDMNVSITKVVYPYVANKYGANVSSVERNIRIAIEKVWTSQDVRKLKELYPYEWNSSSGRPSNSEFIYNMIKKIIRQ